MQKNNSKVINLGCRLNFFESEIIKNVLDKNDIKKKIIIKFRMYSVEKNVGVCRAFP